MDAKKALLRAAGFGAAGFCTAGCGAMGGFAMGDCAICGGASGDCAIGGGAIGGWAGFCGDGGAGGAVFGCVVGMLGGRMIRVEPSAAGATPDDPLPGGGNGGAVGGTSGIGTAPETGGYDSADGSGGNPGG